MTEPGKDHAAGGSFPAAPPPSGLGAIAAAWKARFFPGTPDPGPGLSTELERQAEILRAALAASPDPHFLFDPEFRISYANPAAAQIAPTSLHGPFEPRLRDAFIADEPIAGEITLEERRYDYRLIPLPKVAGKTVGVLALLRDITARAAAEQKLRQALEETEKARALAEQANQAKSRFLAAASHDLRQPLQATRLFLEVLGHRFGKDKEGREILDRAKEALAGCDDLLKTLLDLSMLQADTVKLSISDVPLDVLFSRLLDECTPMADNKGLQLRVVPSARIVRSDPIMLQRMLRNLLNNAIRYTAQGKVLLGCRKHGQHLLICVVDTGCGIAENQLDLIFEEFYQVETRTRNRTEGLGLGLSIVRRQARLLDHRILVRSHPGRGSCFAVSVPPVDPGPAAGAETLPPAPVLPPLLAPGRVVLAIEDDPRQLVALDLALERWSLPVHPASGPAEALAALEQGIKPGLILCDLRLPGAKSGLELVRDLRARLGETVPAVLLTGDTDPRLTAEARASGLAVLHKPFTGDALLAAVRAQSPPAH